MHSFQWNKRDSLKYIFVPLIILGITLYATKLLTNLTNLTNVTNAIIHTKLDYENTTTLHTFIITINHTYPFKKGWSFDYYKSLTNIDPFKPILKLTKPQLLIKGFKYDNYILPLWNPSIIDIKSIYNYQNFMLSLVNSPESINTIKHTKYIVIGRWHNDQCKQSTDQSYFHFVKPKRHHISQRMGSGIILLDNNFGILQYVLLRMDHLNTFNRMRDCRLFAYKLSIFTICTEAPPHTYINKLLWTEYMINNQIQIAAYLSETKELHYIPNNSKIFGSAKNLIPLPYNDKLYFQWELLHSYFIEENLFNNTQIYAFHNSQLFHYKYHNNIYHSLKIPTNKYHQNCGFINLTESDELLGVGHIHYNLYQTYHLINYRPFGIRFGYHYTHFFYTINNKPPFHVKRMSVEFCFNSPFIEWNSSVLLMDCDVVQFVNGMVETVIDNKEYLFVTYGINDCISSIIQIEKQFILDMLMPVEYL